MIEKSKLYVNIIYFKMFFYFVDRTVMMKKLTKMEMTRKYRRLVKDLQKKQ